MTKLRILKVRNESSSATHERDLRGFNDTALFYENGITVHLTVANFPASFTAEQVHSLCKAYGLKHTGDAHNYDWHHFNSHYHLPGDHKKQALTLFYAMMEILHYVPEAHCLIHEHHGLHKLLKDRIHGTKTEAHGHVHNAEVVQQWHTHHKHHHATLQEPIAHYLNHAGIEVRVESHFIHLTQAEITKIHDELSEVQTTKHEIATRKAG